MRQRIRLDTMDDIKKFVKVASNYEGSICLEDNDGHRVSARSLIGTLYALEWSAIYCVADRDISAYLLPWIV